MYDRRDRSTRGLMGKDPLFGALIAGLVFPALETWKNDPKRSFHHAPHADTSQ